jgi:hypothetical protein
LALRYGSYGQEAVLRGRQISGRPDRSLLFIHREITDFAYERKIRATNVSGLVIFLWPSRSWSLASTFVGRPNTETARSNSALARFYSMWFVFICEDCEAAAACLNKGRFRKPLH